VGQLVGALERPLGKIQIAPGRLRMIEDGGADVVQRMRVVACTPESRERLSHVESSTGWLIGR